MNVYSKFEAVCTGIEPCMVIVNAGMPHFFIAPPPSSLGFMKGIKLCLACVGITSDAWRRKNAGRGLTPDPKNFTIIGNEKRGEKNFSKKKGRAESVIRESIKLARQRLKSSRLRSFRIVE